MINEGGYPKDVMTICFMFAVVQQHIKLERRWTSMFLSMTLQKVIAYKWVGE